MARAIVARDPTTSVVCVTGSPRPDLFDVPFGIDLVRLPGITKAEDGAYVPRALGMPTADVVSLRAGLISAVAREFRPDVIVVDHSAIGVGGELLPMLEEQRRLGNALLVLGMRDIVDEPLRARKELAREHTRFAMDSLYHRIFVYGHPHVCDVALEYGLGSEIARKVRYVGVACETHADATDTSYAGPLVTVGGGEDGHPILEAVCDWMALRPEVAQGATVVTGPMMGGEHRSEVMRRALEVGVRVVESCSDFGRLLASASFVIGMGGYNTVYESLALRKRLVIVPRVHPRREQWDRARRLAGLELVDVVEPTALTCPGQLDRVIARAAGRTPVDPADVGLRFDGAQVAAETLLREATGHALPLAS